MRFAAGCGLLLGVLHGLLAVDLQASSLTVPGARAPLEAWSPQSGPEIGL
ncbi:hypothetical protein [Cyanobium sp. PCC 7001]|nr:hypothetical protein [Cyanobium sp. PCC 7001]